MYCLSGLTTILQVNLGLPVPEYLHSGFIGAKGDGGGGNNWSYKTYKAPVKSSPLLYTTFVIYITYQFHASNVWWQNYFKHHNINSQVSTK